MPATTDEEFEVVVVGGGPAGAVAALVLATSGLRVLMLERAAQEVPRIGESLPPAARPLLRDLGLLDAFLAENHSPCFGNRSLWGSPFPHEVDFIRDPNGHGWHLDRPRFDAFLRHSAVERGAVLRQSVRVERVTRRVGSSVSEPQWDVETQEDSRRSIRCRFLIDATGRQAAVARMLGAQRRQIDRLVCTYVSLPQRVPPVPPDVDAATTVESVPAGWWYSALLPSGERILAFHTDSDLSVNRQIRDTSVFLALAEETTLIREILNNRLTSAVRPRVVSANSASTFPVTGDAWLAVGDAATAFDPLSSQGLFNALHSGLIGGQAAAKWLAGETTPLQRYLEGIAQVQAIYQQNLAAYYRTETRWPHSDFWHRRLSSPTLADDTTPKSHFNDIPQNH